MTSQWVIKDGIAVPEPLNITWAVWMADHREDYHLTDDILGINVSTVFLGLDHSFGRGDPILWETMIFDNEAADDGHVIDQWRFSFQADAYDFHEKKVLSYKAMLTPLIPLLSNPHPD